MNHIHCWRLTLAFTPDMPTQRIDSVYMRMIRECWRQIPQLNPQVTCSPLHIHQDGVRGWLYGHDVVAVSDAVDTFRNRSTDLIRRLRGKPDAVIWEYISLNDESTNHHMGYR
jgi:hypothetical protein